MRNFIKHGKTLTCIAPSGGWASGDGVVIGSAFGIASTNAVQGADCEIVLEGVFALPKVSGAISQGENCYWLVTGGPSLGEVTTIASGAMLIGIASDPALTGAATVNVRLNPAYGT